ncbi:RHS repeat-associated core domain-containing protein [Micromonospora sp. NPDC049230]|uniref:RHS repeat-associated core domain-containing protein n=1 Tax=Micromonospora sp. NPDC049230 TaxID=3155502 RepID=UPI0034045116
MSVVLAATMADWVTREPAAAAAPQAPVQQSAPSPQVLERPDEAAALVTARVTGKKVKITSRTSETAEHWALPSGEIEALMDSAPVRFRESDGSWRPIDTKLVARGDGRLQMAASRLQVSLAGPAVSSRGRSQPLASVTVRPGRTFGYSLEGAASVAPVLDGPTALYRDVLPHTDVELVASGAELKETVILQSPQAGNSWLFPLQLDGLTPRMEKDGSVALLDTAGKAVAWIPHGSMQDSRVKLPTGEPVSSAAVDYELVKTAKGSALRVTADAAWLRDPARVWPVRVDPTITTLTTGDVTADSDPGTDAASQNGHSLAAGTDNDGDARSFIHFDNFTSDGLLGKQITASKLKLFHTWSWDCTTHLPFNVHKVTQAWTVANLSSGVWPGPTLSSAIASYTIADNYPACTNTSANRSTGKWHTVTLPTTTFNEWAGGGLNEGLALTASETDPKAWKRFTSANYNAGSHMPKLELTYQSYATVTARTTVPSTPCATGSGAPYINSKTPQLRAQVNDAEGSQVRAEFEWLTASGTRIGGTTVGPGSSGSWLATTVPTGTFTEGSTYSWRVRGNDGIANGPWTGLCSMIIDTTAPSAMPAVSSTAYPAGQWAGAAGTAGNFTFDASGVSDVAAYEYGLNVNPPNQTVNAASLGGSATAAITPTADGPQTLYVRSRDRAGNQSTIRAYTFNVGSGAVTSPKEGDITAAKVAITGVGQAAAAGVTYQWRRGDADGWVSIPAAHVSVAAGGAAVTWPLASSGGGAFPKLNWDVEATLAAADAESIPRDGPLQLRGIFTGGTGGTSSPAKIIFDRAQASAASEEVGPGSVNLITGNYSLSDSDVSVDSFGSDLTVTRSYNTRRANDTDAANMFGPGWVSGTVIEEADAPYTALSVYGSLIQVGLPEGETIGFTKRTAAAFDPEVGMESLKLAYDGTGDKYTLTDDEGNTVLFTRVTGTAAGKYFPTSVTAPGSNQTSTLGWEKVTINSKEIVRPTRMLAPVPDGVNCATLTRGCRALTFTYATATTATGTAEASWGDHVGRVKDISFTAWDPDLATPAMRTVPMARYAYDNAGRLRASWDPRLDWNDAGTTRHLWDTYGYTAEGILNVVKPNAQEPWQLSYTTIPGDPGLGRLHKVTRSALTAGTATQTVVYKVPVSGTGAPYDLSPGQTTRWAQTEAPTDATAVFPANQVPNGNPATGTLPSSYERATVTYLDANAREVNTATPGSHIGATWYDQWGNTVRTLSAGNRARALNTGSSDDAAAESMLARRYSTLNLYSSDGQRLTSTMEPEHDVMLPNGTTVRGRRHTMNTYDQGAPTTGGPYNLVTTQVVAARIWDANGVESDTDQRITTTAYDWALRQPTVVTVDPAGLAQSTRTTYDPVTALTTSTTAPAGGATTNTPATRTTIYYRATSGSGYGECDLKPEWSNLPCRVQSGGQAASGPELPAKSITYDMLNQSRVVTEKTSAGTLRATTTTYDSAGRAYETSVAAPGLGTAVPISRNVYDPATGRLLRSQQVVGGLATAQVEEGYDSLGRQTSYTDADGVTSTTTYDLLGRVATSNDGKATRTYTYDGGAERRGLLTSVNDTQAGTFSGSYDADGTLISETWPNGMQVTTETDETGTQVGMTYVKPGCASTDCTLHTESVVESTHGQWRDRSSSLSEQNYTYDQAGRLTSIQDTIGGQCTTRSYGFSTSSNRTSASAYGPGTDGVCQTSTPASSRTWTYDTADRVNTAGYAYDALGRTTTVPAIDTAVTSGANATITYHSTDLVDTITQGGRTTDYVLDVTGERVRSWTDNASGTALQSVHHYDGDEDSPSWTQETAARFTRPVSGLSAMAGIFDSESAQVDWQITNLHGDLIATIHADDEGLSRTSEATEYGTPRNPGDTGTQRYGWLGAKQRAADTPSGIILMGVRLYNPTTGRFLQVDPVYGGSANPYEYCGADPVNCIDLDGKRAECGCSSDSGWKRPVKKWIQRVLSGAKRLNNKFTNWQARTAARGFLNGARGIRSGWSAAGKKLWSSKFFGVRSRWFGNQGAGKGARAGRLNGPGKKGWRVGWSVKPRGGGGYGWVFRVRTGGGRKWDIINGPRT